MKELIELHLKILALPEDARSENGIDFSREEDESEGIEELPEELQREAARLREAINATLPDDFDYFAFAGDAEEGASFYLNCGEDQTPAAGSEDGTFHPERSLVEQLREVDWEAQRAEAGKSRESMNGMLELTEKMSGPLRPTKSVQREFREEMRDFLKEKRKDAGRIHLLYWDQEHEMMEVSFADGDELREVLPSCIARGSEIVTVIAWGKPLPVERIDALLVKAQQTLRERVFAKFEEAEEEEEDEAEEDGAGAAGGERVEEVVSLPEVGEIEKSDGNPQGVEQ